MLSTTPNSEAPVSDVSDPAVSSHTARKRQKRAIGRVNDWFRGIVLVLGLAVVCYLAITPGENQMVAVGALVALVADARSYLFRGKVEKPDDEA